MNFSKNAAVSVSASALAAVITIITSIVYVRVLGFKLYGVLGFFAALQSVLMLLDLGLTQVVSRVYSSQSGSATFDEGSAFDQFEKIYLSYAIVVFIGVFGFSSLIVNHWLRVDDDHSVAIVSATQLFAATVGFRVLISFYQAVAAGKQKLYTCTLWNLLFVFVLAASVLIMTYWDLLSLYVIVLSTSIVAGIQCLIFRFYAKRSLESPKEGASQFNLKNEFRLSANISLGALAGQIFSQCDRLVLVRILDAESFGVYAVAKVIAGSLYIFTTPFYQVFYAALSRLLNSDGAEIGVDFYRKCSFLFSSFMATASVGMMVLIPELTIYAFGGRVNVQQLINPLFILTISVLVHSVMHIPYALQLAYGVTSVSLVTNVSLLLLGTPIIIYLATTGGLTGASIAVLLVFLSYAFLNTYLTHRSIMKGIGWRWLVLDLFLPILLSFALGYGLSLIVGGFKLSIWQKIPWLFTFFILNSCVLYFLSPHKRIIEFIKSNKWGA